MNDFGPLILFSKLDTQKTQEFAKNKQQSI
jgi:hypothetical protein